MPGGATACIGAPLLNFSREECEKYRHLKYVKTGVAEKFSFENLNRKYFKEYILLLMA